MCCFICGVVPICTRPHYRSRFSKRYHIFRLRGIMKKPGLSDRERLACLWVMFTVFSISVLLVHYFQHYPDVESENCPIKTTAFKLMETMKHLTRPRVTTMETNSKTVHYFWCNRKMFEFHNYLSVLSVIKVVKPMKIVFHFTEMPVLDALEYNSWFRELKATVPYLVLQDLGKTNSCGDSRGAKLKIVLEYLNLNGGLYVGENTVFGRYSLEAQTANFIFSFPRSNENEGHSPKDKMHKSLDGFIGMLPKSSRRKITSAQKMNGTRGGEFSHLRACTMYDFEVKLEQCLTVTVDLPVRPKDIWHIDINFGKLSRLLFYGSPEVITVKRDKTNMAPRISHYIWFGKRRMTYANYLSVLSSLYVAGLHRVYFHGDAEPEGEFWEKLKTEENVTHIYMELPESVYGNAVNNKAHANDVVKLFILDKYGGVNQDPDVFWTQQIQDTHLQYDAVMGFEWVKAPEWPETFNIGVFIAKRHSKFVHELLLTTKDYRDQHWIYNSGCMPYRVYERFPDVLFADRQLQVLCYKHKCHPPWYKDYNEYYMNDEARSFYMQWDTEALSVHLTYPKPYEEFESRDALLNATGMYADLGRNILKKAGKF